MELCRSGRASGTHSVSMLRSKCIAPCTGATLPASMTAVCMYCRACCLCLPAGCAEAAVSFLIVLLPCPATAMTSLVPLSLGERCCTEHTVNIRNCTEFTAEWTTRRNLPRCRCWSKHGPADPSMSVEITQDAGQPVLYPLTAPDLCSTQRVHVTTRQHIRPPAYSTRHQQQIRAAECIMPLLQPAQSTLRATTATAAHSAPPMRPAQCVRTRDASI